uniref:Uncharacterized protein n=1 Tax=Arundo donax TaxID=35708 RepID=A0A0A9CRA2_ARUDO
MTRSRAQHSPITTGRKLNTNRTNIDYSSTIATGARNRFESKRRSRNADPLTSEPVARIRPLRAPAPPGERRKTEQRRQQHGHAEHERRHALQPHHPPSSNSAAAPAPAIAPSSSASSCASARPVRRLLLRLAGVLPHAARSQASRPATAAATDNEESRIPDIVDAESTSGWLGW